MRWLTFLACQLCSLCGHIKTKSRPHQTTGDRPHRVTRRAELQQELRRLLRRVKDQTLPPEERDAALLAYAEEHRVMMALGDELEGE